MCIRQVIHCVAIICIWVSMPTLVMAQGASQSPPSLESSQSQASYGIGRQIGGQLAREGFEGDLLDIRALMLGVQDALARADSRVTQEQLNAAIGPIEQVARQRVNQKMSDAAARNRRDGPKFIEKFKGLEGVQQTASGLLYQVQKKGTGASPKATDVVQTHYRGMLIDGTEFDNSIKRGQPMVIRADKVIAGWTEILQLMKVGDRWRVVIPPNLAYGQNGEPNANIGPDAVLIFDLELLGIGPPADSPPPGSLPR